MLNISRSAILVATTAAMALPTVALAGGPTVYGKANVSIGFVNDDTGDGQRMDTNASRLGVKGAIDASEGLSVTYKYEMQVDVTEANATNLTGRNQYVGLKGSFGQFRFGRHDTPYKLSLKQFDMWADTDLDYNNIISEDVDKRNGDTIYYVNKMDKLTLDVSYTLGDGDESVDPNDGNGSWLALGAAYKEGPLFVGGAYTSEDDGESAFKIGASYAFGAANIGLVYESLDDGDALQDESNIWATMTYKINPKNKLKLAIGQKSVDNDADNSGLDTDRTLFVLGIDHKLADKVTLYFAAASGSDWGLEDKANLDGDSSVVMGGMIVKF